MKIIISVIIFIFLSILLSFSQNNQYFEKGKEFILKEKLKISPSQIHQNLEHLKNIHNKTNKSYDNKINNPKLQSIEYSVSSTQFSESEIHASINPVDSNNIIVAPIEFKTGEIIELDCPVYYTTDFGKTWYKSNFSIIPDDDKIGVGGGGDPMFTIDKDGNAYFSWILLYYTINDFFSIDSIINTMSCVISTNKGATWEPVGNGIIAKYGVNYQNANEFSEFYDKQWMASDLSQSHFSNNVYLSLTHLSTYEYTIELYRKLNGKNQFEKTPTRVNYFNHSMVQFSNMGVDSKGNIHIIFWATEDGSKNSLFHTLSTDGGLTFEKEVKITDFKISGGNMLPGNEYEEYPGLNADRLYPCPQLTIDNSNSGNNGNLYVTWTANGIQANENKSLNVYFSKSTDLGKTWSQPKIVHDDHSKTAKFYPTIAVNPDGVLVLTWYDRRNDANNRLTDYYMTFSFDGGETFIKNFPVTSQSTDFSTVGNLNNNFGIGEYNSLVTTKGYAIPFWADGRNNDGNLNVYSAFIPISKTTMSVESIKPINSAININSISPNPAGETITINYSINQTLNNDKVKFSIYSTELRRLKEISVNKSQNPISINIADIPNGEYLLFLENEGIYSVKKFIIFR